VRECRKEQHDGGREHEHLRAQARTLPVGNEHTPPEHRVIEHEAEAAAEDEQRVLALGICCAKCNGAGRQCGEPNRHHAAIEGWKLRGPRLLGRKQSGTTERSVIKGPKKETKRCVQSSFGAAIQRRSKRTLPPGLRMRKSSVLK
jgi:hypothetical protein